MYLKKTTIIKVIVCIIYVMNYEVNFLIGNTSKRWVIEANSEFSEMCDIKSKQEFVVSTINMEFIKIIVTLY